MPRNLRFPPQETEITPQGPITVRRATQEDAAAVVSAFNDVFGLQRSPQYWLEKFGSRQGMVSFISIDAAGRVFSQFASSPVVLRRGELLAPILNVADVFARRSAAAVRQRLFFRAQRAFHEYFRSEGRYVGLFAFPNQVSLRVSEYHFPALFNVDVAEYYLAAFSENLDADGKKPPQSARVVTYSEFHPDFRSGVESVWRRRLPLPFPPEVGRSPDWAEWRYDVVGRHYGTYALHLVVVDDTCIAWFVTRVVENLLFFIDWTPIDEEPTTYGYLADAFRQIVEANPALQARALASPQALAPFRDFIRWGSFDVPTIIAFGAMSYKRITIPAHDMRITYGDTDLR